VAAPSYIGNGGIAASDNSATVAVPYPSLQANDILILQLLSAGSGSDTHQTPSGFTEILAQTNQSTNMDVSFWWKRAVGTESGNLTCTRSLSNDAFFGIMSCWRGAVTSGTPFNAAASIVTGRSASASSSAITPSYDYSRIICLLSVEDNLGNGTFAGGNYAENFDLSTSTGDDAEFSACSFAQTTAAEEAARTSTIGGTDSWATCTLALWSGTGTTQSLAGSIGATASVTGDLKVKRKLAGTIGGTSALSGNLKGYWPRLGDWRWYADSTSPDTPLADENALYTTTSLSTILRLRTEIVIEGGKGTSTPGTIIIEYSTNLTNWYELGSTAHWDWADGANDDQEKMDGYLVADSGSRFGYFHESKVEYTDYPSDGAVTEEDFAIAPTSNVTTNTTYYFRITGYFGATPVPKATYGAGTYPQAKVTLGTTYSLAGSIAAKAAVAGDLFADHVEFAVDLTSPGSTFSISLGVATWSLAGSIAAQAALSGDVKVTRKLAGSIAAQSTLSADAWILPPLPSGMVAWFDASNSANTVDGSSVASWPDRSGSGNNATQATESKQPTFRTGVVNGRPVIRFDGGDRLQTAAFSSALAQPNTVFFVAMDTGEQISEYITDGLTTDARHAILLGGTGTRTIYAYAGSLPSPGEWGSIASFHILSVVFATTSSDIRRDGNYIAEAQSVGTNALDGLTVGARFSDEEWFSGDIAEIIVFDSELSLANIMVVEEYLSSKYGIGLTHEMAGAVAAQSALAGDLTVIEGSTTWDLAGSVAAQVALAGNAKVTRKLAGSIAAASTVTGNLELTEALWSLQGAAAAQSTVSGDAKVTRKLAGAIAAQSALSGNLQKTEALWSLAGAIAAQSALAGNLEVQHKTWDLAGAIAAASALTGDLVSTEPWQNIVLYTPGSAFNILLSEGAFTLSGHISATSALVGDLEVEHTPITFDLAGTIGAQSAVAGNLRIPMTYYVAMGGTAANKEAATGPETDLSKCMSNYYNNDTAAYDPGDTVFVTGYGGTIDYLSFRGGSSSGRVNYVGSTNYPAIVDGARVTTGWTNYSGNIWQKTGITWHPQQLWINGTYGDRKTSIGNCVNEFDWFYDEAADTIYLYAASDPDTLYTNPGVEVPEQYAPAGPGSYVNVDNITIRRGCQNGCFGWNVSHVKFTNCTFEWSWWNGLGIQGDASTITYDIVVEDCVARFNGNQGLSFPSIQKQVGIVIRRCKAYQNGTFQFADPRWGDDMLYSGGIKIWNYAEDCIIEDCEVYSNGPSTLGSNSLWFGQGIWLDGAISSAGHENIVRHNRVYDNHGVALYCELTTYSIWHNNVCYDNAKEPDTGNWCNASIRCDARESMQSSHNKFYNNTLVGGQHGIATMVTDTTGEVSYNEFKNNIIIGTNSAKIKATNGGDNITYGHDNVYSHNCLGAEATGFVIWTTAKDTYDAWETAYGGTTNSIEADPVFEDDANDKYWLAPSSPCKNAGLDLGDAFEDGLHYPSTWPDGVVTLDQDSYGSAWEVGAYVYVGQLAGAIAAQSALTGNLEISEDLVLQGQIAAQSSLTGAIKLTQKLAGTIAAQSSLVGEAKITRQLAGSVAAQSSLTGTLKLQQKLAGAVAAQSALAGDLGITEGVWNLAGTVSSLSSLSGALKLQQRLQGAVSAFSSLVGNLQVQHATWDLNGEIYARTAGIEGDLRVIRKLVGAEIFEKFDAIATLQIVHAVWNLQGLIFEDVVLVKGGLLVKRKLTGAIAAQSALTGNLQSTEAAWSLAGSVAAQVTLTGNLVNLSDIPKLLHPHNSWINVYSEPVTLTEIPVLVVSNGLHYHYASSVYVHQQLVVSDASHSHTIQNVTFALAEDALAILSSAHALTSEEVDLLNSLLIANARHYHSVMNVNIPYGPTAKEGMGLVDALFALNATMKLPPYPMHQNELLKFCQQLYWQLQTNYIPQTDRIENMTMVGLDEQRPDPVGLRQMFFATDTATLYIDVKTSEDKAEWFSIAAGAGTNEIHEETLSQNGVAKSLFWFQGIGRSHGCILNYWAQVLSTDNYEVGETGAVAFTVDYTNNLISVSKLGSPAVVAAGGLSASFVFGAFESGYGHVVTVTPTLSGGTFDHGTIHYSPWFGNLSEVQYEGY